MRHFYWWLLKRGDKSAEIFFLPHRWGIFEIEEYYQSELWFDSVRKNKSPSNDEINIICKCN